MMSSRGAVWLLQVDVKTNDFFFDIVRAKEG